MNKAYSDEGVRERLIVSGILEFEEHGFIDFSLRRVATKAQVSCAAPYRHFKDKDELILAVIRYVRDCWTLLCRQIKEVYEGSSKRQITELCVSGVRFWMANGSFRSVLMGGTFDKNEDIKAEIRLFDKPILDSVKGYCEAAGLDEERQKQLCYSVGALFWGTVMIASSAKGAEGQIAIDLMKRALSNMIG